MQDTESVGKPKLKMGEINERLGFTIRAEFLAGMGIVPAATEKAAKLFHESQFIELCDGLIKHIEGVRDAALKR